MSTRCSRLLFFLSIVAFSILAESNSPALYPSRAATDSIVSFQVPQEKRLNTDLLFDINIDTAKDRQSELLSDFFQFKATDSKEFSSENLPLIPTLSSVMLFRDNLQIKPIYWLKAEIDPSNLAIHTLADLHSKKDVSPWFMQSHQKACGRLSGWKDGNSLYTASITYH